MILKHDSYFTIIKVYNIYDINLKFNFFLKF